MHCIPRPITLSVGFLALSRSVPPRNRCRPDAAGDASTEDMTALAKKLQNPLGGLYSFPFQTNTNFNYGPNKGTQDILNIQPVPS